MSWVVVTLPIGRPFRLVSVPFQYVCFFCSAISYFLAPQDAPGSSGIFFVPVLKSTTLLRRLGSVNWKKKKKKTTHTHSVKVENYVLFGDIAEDYIAGETASQLVLRNSSKEVREEPGYMGDSAEK